MSESAERLAWRWTVLVLAVVVITTASFRMVNLDIWLHAATGEWIVEQGAVPSSNVLSELHHDYPSVHDKWGFQVLAHGLLDGLGPDGVNLARLLLVGLLVALMGATARGLGASPGATMLLLTLGLLAARNRLVFRPGLVSMVLLALLIFLLLVRHRDGRRAWMLLPLQLFWVNVHGFFVLGWMTVLVVAGAQGCAGQWQIARRWLGWALLMMVVCFANPAGLAGWAHPFTILSDLNGHRDFYTTYITEFRPILADDPQAPGFRTGFFVLAGLSAVLLLWAALRSWGKRRSQNSGPSQGVGPVPAGAALGGTGLSDVLLPALALLAMFGLMSTSLRRNIAPFAVVMAPLAAAAWTSCLGRKTPGLVVPTALALLFSVGEVTDAMSIHDGSQRRSGFGISRIAYPVGGIEFIGEHLPDARVFTAFGYGSTFTGMRRPLQRAATNGNTHGYPTQYLQDVIAATADTDPGAFLQLTTRHDLSAALIPMGAPLAPRLLRSADWALVFVGRQEAVFVRRRNTDEAWLAEHDLEAQLSLGRELLVPGGELSDDRPWWRQAPGPTTLLLASRLLFAGGYEELATSLAEQAVAVAPDDAQALSWRGLLLFAAGDRDASQAMLLRSQEAHGFNVLAQDVRTVLMRIESQ
ncbi:MAG: hypothetical protein ACI9EF_002709 [Pseudohongiellaceae bacterium]|jgi:hypothetical protein